MFTHADVQRRNISAVVFAFICNVCDLRWVINYISTSGGCFSLFNFQYVKTFKYIFEMNISQVFF